MRGALAAILIFVCSSARADRTCHGDRDCAPFEECDASHQCVSREAKPDDPDKRVHTGRVLAGFGAFFAVLGGALVGVGLSGGAGGEPLGSSDYITISGGAILAVGVILSAAGVPIWATSARDANRGKPPVRAALVW